MMDAHEVRHLPVIDGHELVGIVTDRDVRSVLSPPIGRRVADDLTVADVYVPDAYVVDLNEPIEVVLLTMAETRTDAAVVTRKGRLAGVFTSVDACRCFAEHIRENFPRPDGDAAA